MRRGKAPGFEPNTFTAAAFLFFTSGAVRLANIIREPGANGIEGSAST